MLLHRLVICLSIYLLMGIWFVSRFLATVHRAVNVTMLVNLFLSLFHVCMTTFPSS